MGFRLLTFHTVFRPFVGTGVESVGLRPELFPVLICSHLVNVKIFQSPLPHIVT